jgi:hypothetical protein
MNKKLTPPIFWPWNQGVSLSYCAAFAGTTGRFLRTADKELYDKDSIFESFSPICSSNAFKAAGRLRRCPKPAVPSLKIFF